MRIEWLDKAGFALALLFVPLLACSRAGADIALSCTAVLFLLRALLGRDVAWASRRDAQAALCMYGAVAVSGALHHDAALAIAWGRFPLFYLALRYWLLNDGIRLRRFGTWTACVLLVVAVDTIAQYFTGTSLTGHPIRTDGRLTGPLTHPNIGNYITKLLFPTAGLALAYATGRRTMFLLCGILALAAMVLLTGERSVSLLLLLGMGVTCLGVLGGVPQARRIAAMYIAVFAVMVAALLSTQTIVQTRSHQLVSDVAGFWATPYGQLVKGGYLLWRTQPVLGIGPGQYLADCPALQEAGSVTYCDVHPHNIHLQWLAETGLLGYACFAVFLFLLLHECCRKMWYATGTARLLPLSTLATLAVLFFPFIVTQSLFSNWPAALLWGSLGFAMAMAAFPSKVAV